MIGVQIYKEQLRIFFFFSQSVYCYCNLNQRELRGKHDHAWFAAEEQLASLMQQTSVMRAVFKLFKNCFSEGHGELLIDAYPHPGAAAFHSTTLVSGEVGGVGGTVLLTEWDCRLAQWSWAPALGSPPPPSVTAQRVSALCLSAFLGQDDHSHCSSSHTYACTHTNTSASTQMDTTAYNH